MRGTITRHTPKNGKPTFGYYFVAGRDANGKRIQETKSGFAKKSEAEEALRKAIEARGEAPTLPQKAPTFREFFERWDRECFSRECAPKTSERYRELAVYAFKLFGDTPIDQIQTMQLAEAVNQLSDHGGRITKAHPKGRPLKPKTVRHIAFLVQGCLQQAAVCVVFGNSVFGAVQFSGLAPGFVGLWQINVQIPSNAPTGNAVSVYVVLGGIRSNSVIMSIQ